MFVRFSKKIKFQFLRVKHVKLYSLCSIDKICSGESNIAIPFVLCVTVDDGHNIPNK